jgi:acetate kinase
MELVGDASQPEILQHVGVGQFRAVVVTILDPLVSRVIIEQVRCLAPFCYQTRKWIGSFAAVLGGLETLVFAGGIGENAAEVLAGGCSGLGFLGIDLDEARNAVNSPRVSTEAGRVAVRVIRTDEEL